MSQPTAERTRTVSWHDPAAVAGAAAGRTGAEFLRTAVQGTGAPIAALLGFRLVEVEEGRVVFELEPGEHLYNPIGTIHGGALSTVLDSALGCAVHSTLPEGVAYTSLDLAVRFLRPASVASGVLRCEGRVVHGGRRTATAAAEVVDAAGKLVATGTSTCIILRP